MRAVALLVVAIVGLAAGCGSGDPPGAIEDMETDGGDETTDGEAADGEDGGDAGDGGEATSVGPADMNTIRIGSQVWERTLPMTSGQCFVQNVEGLPPSGVAWGTLDADDGIRFRASQNQDGTTEAEVDDQESYYWIAGPRVADGPDDLVIELDFEALTIVGEGTFTNLFTGETAPGSFAFQCEDDGTGG